VLDLEGDRLTMKRQDEKETVQAIEADAADPDAWEDDPPPAGTPKRVLGTSVTIRLEPELAEQLRRLAATQGVGYTSMIRGWIEDRLRGPASSPRFYLSGRPGGGGFSTTVHPASDTASRITATGARLEEQPA
jgi:hypothetical protein